MSEQEKNPLLNTKHSIHFYIQDGRAHIVKDKGSLDAEYSFTIRDGVVCVYRLLWKLEEFHWYIEPPLVLECFSPADNVRMAVVGISLFASKRRYFINVE